MKDYKGSTHDMLMSYYQNNGLMKTIEIGRAMLQSNSYKSNTAFIAHVHGEIAETILECIILDYIERYNLKKYGWFYKKGLILRDINHTDSGYYTELDLTVFTPQKIFAFVLFDFATGETVDERLPQHKILMPCLNESNVSNIFKLNYNKPVMWDIQRVQKAIEIIASHTKQNTIEHLKYVKSLHSDKE